MTIRPIRNEDDYESALDRVALLMDTAAPESSEADELEVLAILIEAYEGEHHPVDPPDPIDAIEFRMDQAGLTRRQVEEMVGLSRARLSEVLNRRRGLSIAMIRAFHEALGIPADILVRDYPLAS